MQFAITDIKTAKNQHVTKKPSNIFKILIIVKRRLVHKDKSQSRLVVITIFYTWRLYVLTFQNLAKQSKFQVRIVIVIGWTVDLAEWIIDDTCSHYLQHLVLLLNSILAYAIPDVPNNLKTQLLRERQLQREIEFEMDRLHTARTRTSEPLPQMEEEEEYEEGQDGGIRKKQSPSETLRIRSSIRRNSLVFHIPEA